MWFFKKKKENKVEEPNKKEVKEEVKPTKESTKEEAKKENVKKVEVKKTETKPEEVKTTKKSDSKSVYHVSKREEDGVWQVKYTGGRVLKLCKTKEEAMEYAKNMAANQNGTVIFHPSKGQNKGKFQKAK